MPSPTSVGGRKFLASLTWMSRGKLGLRMSTARDPASFFLSCLLLSLWVAFILSLFAAVWTSYPCTEMSRKGLDGHFWIFSRTRRNFSVEPTRNFSSDKIALDQVSCPFLKQPWQESPLGLGWALLLLGHRRSVGKEWVTELERGTGCGETTKNSCLSPIPLKQVIDKINASVAEPTAWLSEIHDPGQGLCPGMTRHQTETSCF